MDIHRCRFVSYPSSAINALSFSHSSTTLKGSYPTTLRLAVGRANGNIEIWNPHRGHWFQETILQGGKDRSVESLAWIQDPEDVDKRGNKVPGRLRLFSIGYSEMITEWDLASGRPLRHSSANRGEIWCMTAQPKDDAPERLSSRGEDEHRDLEIEAQRQAIAVGCADGSVVLLSTDEDLRFQKIVARPGKRKTRVLSLAFQNRNTIVAGHADSTIRIYDIRGGQQIRNLSLGAGPKGGPKETLMWTVKCLKDGTIVCGDSNGVVSFWDGKHYALLQRIQGHEADVLDLAVGIDGRTVFSGGIDRRTTLYQKPKADRADRGRWAKSSHVRMHKNDIKAMATFETPKFSVMASGGLDTNLLITPVQSFSEEHHRALSCLPQQVPLASAPQTRYMLSWWGQELRIWSVTSRTTQLGNENTQSELPPEDPHKLLAKILLQGDEHITSAALAPNGQIIAVSTIAETKFFKLQKKDFALKVRPHTNLLENSKTGTRVLQFSPDGHWLLLLKPDNSLSLLRLVEDNSRRSPVIQPSLVGLQRLRRDPVARKAQHGSLGRYDRSITRVAFSSDSKMLATCDISGYIDTWLLEGYEDLDQEEEKQDSNEQTQFSSDPDSDSDSETEPPPTLIFGQKWIRNPAGHLILKLEKPPLVLSFRPSPPSTSPTPPTLTNGVAGLHPTRHTPHPHSHDLPKGEDRLLIITCDNSILELNILTGRLSDWFRRNPPRLLPAEYRELRDPAKGILWDVNASYTRIWIYGVSWLWMFDPSRDFLNPDARDNDDDPLSNQKRLTNGTSADNESHETTKKRKRRGKDTGAGSRRHDSELNLGISRISKQFEGADPTSSKLITLEQSHNDDFASFPPSSSSSDDDEDDIATSKALLSLRRGGDDAMDLDGPSSDAEEEATNAKKPPAFWRTLKYRPIFGIVPIGNGDEGLQEEDGQQEGGKGGLEVALVERPPWDMDLPARYHGEHEWKS